MARPGSAGTSAAGNGEPKLSSVDPV
uniref:Uncharacterized protein n=1 Tax=Arundo donax TaxID=35708 RepID=A0A0A9CWK3_ARUDO